MYTICTLYISWIEKDGCIFAKPAGLEMHAGRNPKLIITAKGIGRLESHDSKQRTEGKEGKREGMVDDENMVERRKLVLISF